MKQFEVKYHVAVRVDIQNARNWYRNHSPQLERRFVASIKVGIEKLSKNPQHNQKRYRSLRVLQVDVFPYGIYYLWDNSETIIILSVFHNARNPAILQERMT